ncbi:methylthioribose-1-phosphate isomerase-like [Centruroides sculpturatus]|uniref:methylthioribose-1-phosphate isomerase-like n=1 Tax=Centruroides sculpturatus TaxID=218467 RepID=UPI000C6E7BFF|nr:methylthioribose-1-phosphate isomerase-like [Centruroides sculpturatus]
MLEAIIYEKGKLKILDQLQLPHQTSYIPISNVKDGWDAIHYMKVRGAPAIALVGALSLAVELQEKSFVNKDQLHELIIKQLEYLVTARPTAVNMKNAAKYLCNLSETYLQQNTIDIDTMKNKIINEIENMLNEDVKVNKLIGDNGANHILKYCCSDPLFILTHCNTGSLATAGYGTALGKYKNCA